MREKHQMSLLPKQETFSFRWALVFGSAFLKTHTESNVDHYICSIHWKQIRHDWEVPMAKELENVKKENNGSLEVQNKCTCRYCGAQCFEKEMQAVPADEDQLSKWGIRLGQEFLENVRHYKNNFICLKHFKHCGSAVGNIYRLPMTDEMMENESIQSLFEKCRFCGDARKIAEMVLVPDDQVKRAYWVENLGSIFANNISNNSTNYICWSHFNLPSSLKQYYMKYLPCAKPQTIRNPIKNVLIDIPKRTEALAKCCVCGKPNKRCQMTVAPKQKHILEKMSAVFGSEFLETCTRSQINQYICSIHWKQFRNVWERPLREVLQKTTETNNGHSAVKMSLNAEIGKDHFETFKVQDVNPKIVIKQEKSLVFKKCRYCDDVLGVDDMVLVPEDRLRLARWVNNLGPVFSDNLILNSTNYICWSHFKLANWLKPDYLKYLPYRNSKNSNLNMSILAEMYYVERKHEVITWQESMKVEDIERKPDLEMLNQEIKLEKEEKNKLVLMPDYPCSTNIEAVNENKPGLIVKEE